VNIEKTVIDHALVIALGLLLLLFAFAGFIISARAQSIEIGPGGFSIGQQRHGRGHGEVCAELRRACMYKEERGEEGMGNCRRYRESCQY
jgi:hypothetical protein